MGDCLDNARLRGKQSRCDPGCWPAPWWQRSARPCSIPTSSFSGAIRSGSSIRSSSPSRSGCGGASCHSGVRGRSREPRSWASSPRSCGLAGEPQSMLLAGIVAGGWAMLGAGAGAAPRALARLALCGACGVLLSAPATLPAAERLRLGDSRRLERAVGVFALDARRLPGLALPWAFDDAPELTGPGASDTPYSEYFSGEPHVAFAGSIALGVPVLVLAAFGR